MNMRINGERLWDSLMQLGQIGATDKGGVNRVAFTDLDREARDLFCRWSEEAGCDVRIDRFGNVFARRPGKRPSSPAVLVGSHLDSQPTGGRFDGTYGVMAGLEILRSMQEHDVQTDAPVDVVAWTAEEGYLFKPMMGSAVWTGLLGLDEALAMKGPEGWSIGERLAEMGYAGDAGLLAESQVACYLEAHIEQGPVLEESGDWLGVVDSTQGQRWYDLVLTGREAHAGPTPMALRRDALMGMSRIALEIDRIARDNPPGCGTVGRVNVHPNSPNTIPGKVAFSADLRHPDGAVLDRMDTEFRERAARLAADSGLMLELSERAHILPLAFDGGLAAALEAGARSSGHPWRRMYTGAGHDACNIARFVPTAMLFVPCKDGISHNEAEDAKPEHLSAGTQVLAEVVISAASGRVPFGKR